MKVKKPKAKIITVVGVLIGILGYWTVDFTEDRSVFNTVIKILGPGAFFGAMVSTYFRKRKPYNNALLIVSGVAIGMLSRILWDIILHPSSHINFPFELLIGIVIVLPAAFIGSLVIHGIYLVAGK